METPTSSESSVLKINSRLWRAVSDLGSPSPGPQAFPQQRLTQAEDKMEPRMGQVKSEEKQHRQKNLVLIRHSLICSKNKSGVALTRAPPSHISALFFRLTVDTRGVHV